MPGLYLHVPFCVKKCAYCDFYSLPVSGEAVEQRTLMDRYVEAVLREASAYAGMSFHTLYLGGGTPSLLGVEKLKRLLDGLHRRFDLSKVVEATIEVNPESVSASLLEAAGANGINRVSIGVQSLNDRELQRVGRVHNSAQAQEALVIAGQSGLEISADLIIGLPEQTWSSLQNSVGKLNKLGVSHLSVYCLSLEPDTPLGISPPKDLPDDDTQVDLFEKAKVLLESQGFIHYEISNFARPGHEAKHNVNYWKGGEYLGLGPAAASHLAGKRFRNRSDLKAYLENPTGQIEEIEELTGEAKAAEEAMLRLRLLVEGIDTGELARRYGEGMVKPILTRLEGMVEEGLLIHENSSYRLAPARILTSNPVFGRVLGS